MNEESPREGRSPGIEWRKLLVNIIKSNACLFLQARKD
jgi:hypothetical protein